MAAGLGDNEAVETIKARIGTSGGRGDSDWPAGAYCSPSPAIRPFG